MLVRIANSKDPDLGLHSLLRSFWQVTCVQNLRTSATLELCFSFFSPFKVDVQPGDKANKVKGPGVDKEVTASSIRAGIHKIFDRIANSEDPDQTASSEAV